MLDLTGINLSGQSFSVNNSSLLSSHWPWNVDCSQSDSESGIWCKALYETDVSLSKNHHHKREYKVMWRWAYVRFILGLASSEVLAVSSHTSYLKSVYDWADRHKNVSFGGFAVQLGRTYKHCGEVLTKRSTLHLTQKPDLPQTGWFKDKHRIHQAVGKHGPSVRKVRGKA